MISPFLNENELYTEQEGILSGYSNKQIILPYPTIKTELGKASLRYYGASIRNMIRKLESMLNIINYGSQEVLNVRYQL